MDFRDEFRASVIPRVAIAVLVAVVCISGCGGGGGSPSDALETSSQAMSKSELIAKADAICAKTDLLQERKMEAYGRKEPAYGADRAGFVKMVAVAALPEVRFEVEEIAALGAPKGEEAAVAAIVAGYEKAQRIAEAHPGFALGFTEGPFTGPAKLAKRYGFKACAKPL